MKTTIREIRNNVPEGRRNLVIYKLDKGFALIAHFKDSFNRLNNHSIRLEVSTKRLQQLANDILNYMGKQVKWEEWKPTMEELERRLNETYHGDGVYMWFIDWVRLPWNKKAGKRIFEWMKMADETDGFWDD